MQKNILVIDDDPFIIRTVEKYLKNEGYDIHTASSGKEALEKIKKSRFDLIISDVRMPEMNGIETIKQIRESSIDHNKEKVPAILITGYASEDEIYRKLGEVGVVECIYKPFELDEFINVIRKNLELPPKYKRSHARVDVAFPVEVTVKSLLENDIKKINGETIDLSEDGIGLILDCILPISSLVNIHGKISSKSSLQMEASIIWVKPIFKDGYYRCGLHFLNMENEDVLTLRKILADHKLLDSKFISLTKDIETYVKAIKEKFDKFDESHRNEDDQIDFIEKNKKEIFATLDNYFSKVWEIIKKLDKDKYIVYQNCFHHSLRYLMLELIEINRYGYNKPLGYPGDYNMMNYIYDYHKDKYLGVSSYEKLINNYTCNISISCSNIKRKDFLKEHILKTLKIKDKAKILSVASGSARELVELLNEGKINKTLKFKCLDFEKKSLDCVSDQLKKVLDDKKRLLDIEYFCKDLMSIIRDKDLKKELSCCDLIYAFGIFDYLSDRMASRLTKELYQLLGRGGTLIICNINAENTIHRGYYEFLGEWNMVHRVKEELLACTKSIEETAKIQFEPLSETSNYLFLSISKV